MDLTSYVDSLRRELVVAAEAGGPDAFDAQVIAERLYGPLESATRLMLLEALSAAADEITRDLAPGSVEVRLRGRDPEFVVNPPPAVPSVEDGLGGTAPSRDVSMMSPEGEDGGTARITLRLPTHLKPRIDEAANRAGLSVNAWLVRAVSVALQPDDRARPAGPPDTPTGRRYRGWVR